MPANYVLLGEVTVGASVASVAFTNIPATGYSDLKVVACARTDRASEFVDYIEVRPNNSSANLSSKFMYFSNTTAGSSTATSIYGAVPSTTATANTYSATNIYITNYNKTNVKTFQMETVSENNNTSNYGHMVGGIWNSSSTIASLYFYSLNGANWVAGSTFYLYGIAALGTDPVIYPKATGGDIIVNDGTYWYHAFLSSGTFTPSSNLSCSALVIAGGGGGGSNGGGGGAGGLLPFTLSLTPISYAVTVGAGGAGGNNANGTTGNDAQFGSETLVKGGGGGGAVFNNGLTGGSGGGAGRTSSSQTGGSATSGQGNAGGNSTDGGGGGGGKGSVGANNSGANGGNGGSGVNTYSAWATATNTGASGFYSGGGGGGSAFGSAGSGSNGGGNGSAGNPAANASNATALTGGGGGGAGAGAVGGNGGSGVVIVRYTIA